MHLAHSHPYNWTHFENAASWGVVLFILQNGSIGEVQLLRSCSNAQLLMHCVYKFKRPSGCSVCGVDTCMGNLRSEY